MPIGNCLTDYNFFMPFCFKIRPFREAHKNRHKDKELLKLAKYLKKIAKLDDFSNLNHKYWERSVDSFNNDVI